MTDAVERAKTDLAHLDDKIRRAEETIHQARIQKAEIETFLRMYEHYSRASTAPVVGEKKIADREIADAAERVILERGSPQKLPELCKALADRGMEIPGKNKAARVSQALSRDKRFHPIEKRGGWWLERLSRSIRPESETSESVDSSPDTPSTGNAAAIPHSQHDSEYEDNAADAPKAPAAQLFERPA